MVLLKTCCQVTALFCAFVALVQFLSLQKRAAESKRSLSQAISGVFSISDNNYFKESWVTSSVRNRNLAKLRIKDSLAESTTAGQERFNFKIYVYDLPLWANTLIHKRNPWCSKGVFSSEIYIHNQLLKNAHGVRTFNPEEADFFFVPVYATCLVYRSFSQFPKYRFLVEEVLKFIINEMPYWKRTQGRDHIWPFVHDFGGCLSWLDNTDHVYFKELRNSIFLSHLGDLNMGCFNTHKDVVIPPLMTDPRLWRDGRGGQTLNIKNKTIFAHFRGTVNWYHDVGHYPLKIKGGFSPHYSNGVRQYLLKTYKDDALMKIYEGPSKNYYDEV
jgi:putative beta-1,4-xylosyltransferase IRX10